MELPHPPRHLRRTLNIIRTNPIDFYRRTEADKKFFLEQFCLWLDNHFQAQSPEHIRLRALSLNMISRVHLEARMLRFVRFLVFPDFPSEQTPSAADWFTFRYLQPY